MKLFPWAGMKKAISNYLNCSAQEVNLLRGGKQRHGFALGISTAVMAGEFQ